MQPNIIKGIDLRNFMSKTNAASGPVQPPRSGMGVAVRINTANSPQRSNFFAPRW